ncbi:MAG: Cyclopropane-fatty-acyl-phospholipid synthase [Alphaproteobacteria bacterium ADurb.BinA280]|jgi:cyclopropane-fatty-acyl-phospholipid synthase|nr:MAG: Cyclopropane-fatty-acyl-phospholipid synthase [Alphaproteobacteria bacterium ADurb.BinA280]
MNLIDLSERGWIPDFLIRRGIRRLCQQRLQEERGANIERAWDRFQSVLNELRSSPLAIETDAANTQHYEVPARFFELCLGKRLKYSSCFYPDGNETLDQAEEHMLALYAERAALRDGQQILELGCGWGSLTLYMAERFPSSRILGVSNSHSQRSHILAQCQARGLTNVEILTTDVNDLQLQQRFDRVVSVEMFEHVRNYAELLRRIRHWLTDDGRLFVHIFCHRELMYPFETEGHDNWMGRHFFTGGLMPAADTFLHFQSDLRVMQQWRLSGRHYQQTANDWLANQDSHHQEVLALFKQTYGPQDAALWVQRWRMFWMACAELFGYAEGNEWLVAHYVFAPQPT